MSERVTPNSFNDFYQKFFDLQTQARLYGIDSVFILTESDALLNESKLDYGHSGNFYASIGALEIVKANMSRHALKELKETQE